MRTYDALDIINGLNKKQEIVDLKKFLADTDYVVSKIAEAEAFGEDTSQLKLKYAEVIRKRKDARARIDELEN